MKTIKRKITLTAISSMTISLLIVGSVTMYLNFKSTNSTLEQTMNETAEIASSRIQHELNEYSNVSYETGGIARLTNNNVTVEEKKAIIDQRAKSHSFERGNIIGKDGISIFDGNNYSERDYFKSAINGKRCISEPIYSKITGKKSIIVAAPLWKGGIADSTVEGVVYYVPKETFLNDIVKSINIGKTGSAYIINKNGLTIADNTMDTVLEQNIEEMAKTDSGLNNIAEIHKKMRNGESGFDSYSVNGVEKFISYAPIEGTDGWSLAINADKSEFMSDTYTGIKLTAVLIFLFVIFSSIAAYILSRMISNPIGKCVERIKKLSEGDIHSAVEHINTKDETRILADTTYNLVETLKTIIGDTGYVLSEMAKGNFTVNIDNSEEYKGDFINLYENIEKIKSSLSVTLKQIDLSSNRVLSSASQVSDSAQLLAQGATEQASSIQQLAATTADIAQKIDDNAKKAVSSNEAAKIVENNANLSSDKMDKMLNAMNEISNCSHEIEKIIKTIDDIAFQTNLLALNAAVEAARAGSAGRGFSIVADEVRVLASKSSDASKDTATLIENSIISVKNGIKIANETADLLNEVVNGIKEVSTNVNLISHDSESQAYSTQQINIGVEQISNVVQTNSATAEESAATSEELNNQAQMLKNMISKFKLN